MRDINECTAEVFRRSEKRIKERKRKRNRILACCAPFVICLTVLSMTVLPKTVHPSRDFGENAGNDVEGTVVGSVIPYVRVETYNIDKADQPIVLNENDADVMQIYNKIQAVFADSDGGNETLKSEISSSEYRITFTTANETQTIYSIRGNKLIDEATHQEAILSVEQKEELIALLGLTIQYEEVTQ